MSKLLAAVVALAFIALAYASCAHDPDAGRAECLADGGNWQSVDGIGDPICIKPQDEQ